MDPITKLEVNKTTTFLLPMLFPDSTHSEIFSNYFKQAYIGLLDDDGELDYRIVLEFDEENVTPDLIDDFLNNLQPQAKIESSGGNLLSFEIEDEFNLVQYEHFLKGTYSKFWDEYKTSVMDFWGEEEGSLLDGILKGDKEIVEKYLPYIDREIVGQIKELESEESWPSPNLFTDELMP